ncbi:MAG: accessory factor UbiK family protein [Alphaproteobacteria bacterium]
MQTSNRILDDLARVAGGALGTLNGVRAEIESLVRQRLERALANMDLVPREEFEAVKAMAAKAREENEALARRIAALEAAAKPAARRAPAKRTTAGKAGTAAGKS